MKKSVKILIALASVLVIGSILVYANWNNIRPQLILGILSKATFKQQVCTGTSHSSMRILFVGNSFLFVHLVPWAVACFAEAKEGDRPAVYQIVKPAYTLEQHYTDGVFQTLIKDGHWDVVVLQEQSGRSKEEPERVFKYASLMTQLARRAGADVILFEDWADRGDVNKQQALDVTFQNLANALHARLAPVGAAYFRNNEDLTKMNLYAVDNHHSSPYGAYLTTCVLYETIYGASSHDGPTSVTYPTEFGPIPTISVTEEQATTLQQLATQSKLPNNVFDHNH